MEAYIGQLALVAFDYAPEGWLPCNGQILSLNQYQALFALLGNRYGGNGVNNFALPDLRGRVPVHCGQGPQTSQYNIGQVGGAEQVTLTAAQMPLHNHSVATTESQADKPNPNGFLLAANSKSQMYSDAQPSSNLAAASVSYAGGGQAHSNVQPYVAMNWIICVQGLFPSRS